MAYNTGDDFMRVLFCKISSMKYYKGHCDNDVPQNGGAFVNANGYGHEEFNFMPIESEESGELECIGFVEPKSTHGKRNSVHIEKIEGCADMKNEDFVEGVLVIWCATRDKRETTVVGWYKDATVFRYPVEWTLNFGDGSSEDRIYNVIAKAEDSTLLPYGSRNNFKWNVPSAKYTRAYGFGQSMLWYPTEPEAKGFLERLLENIESYDGENWLNEYPED